MFFFLRLFLFSAKNVHAAIDILQKLAGMSPGGSSTCSQNQRRGGSKTVTAATPAASILEARKRAHLRAAVRVLGRNTTGVVMKPLREISGSGGGGRWQHALPPVPLADTSIRLLLKELNDIVDPPRKLPRFKVHLRRAPTQEVCVFEGLK